MCATAGKIKPTVGLVRVPANDMTFPSWGMADVIPAVKWNEMKLKIINTNLSIQTIETSVFWFYIQHLGVQCFWSLKASFRSIEMLNFTRWNLVNVVLNRMVSNSTRFTRYIYVIYRLGGPDRKIFSRGLKNSPRPTDVFETEGKYFSMRTDWYGK